MSGIPYVVRRNVPAQNDAGAPCLVALVFIPRENGVMQTVAINEAMIADLGEGVIEHEIRAALASPSDGQFGKEALLTGSDGRPS